MTQILRRTLVGITLTGLLSTITALPATALRVDDYAGYEAQTHCASAAQPGTRYLMRWLLRQYPGTGSSSMLRACTPGSSEHKDGRALDWSVDADVAADRQRVAHFLDRIFAPNRNGQRHAMARRMGIMYLIWDDNIYSSYRSFERRDYTHSVCESVRKCSKTLRHRDHVHISLSRAGAAAQSTFFRYRGVRSVPVFKPGTRQLDPERNAIVKTSVPADGSTVTTDYKLTRGETYRIVADGLYRFGPGTRVGDAACRWGARVERWVPYGNGLRVGNRNLWADASCDGRHAHVVEHTPGRTGYLKLRLGDSTPGNNSGSVDFYILRDDVPVRSVVRDYAEARPAARVAKRPGPEARRLVREAVNVRASARRGVLTTRSLKAKRVYRVVVRGVARSGSTRFDGNCVRYAGRWHPQHSLNPTRPAADHLSLSIQGVRVKLAVPGSARACNAATHRYVGKHKAVQPGKARLRIWDPFAYANNSGGLRVTLKQKS